MTSTRFILFLDFDGVTHPEPCPVDQRFTRLPLIEEVLREFRACQVVISSSWRCSHSMDTMCGYFSADVRSRVIGVTPELDRSKRDWYPQHPSSFSRQAECEAWLIDNGLADARWLAIDDSPWWFEPGHPGLLVTDRLQGFTPEDAQTLRMMMGRW